MSKFILSKEIPVIRYIDCKIDLPGDVSDGIENHWRELIESGKSFSRGDVFTIKKIKNLDGVINIDIALSDYAHYLATIHGILDEKYFCRVVHSSVMIETDDNFLIFGEMNSNTALPGRIQCIGGGITRGDLSGDGIVIDIEKNAKNEMSEEVGLFSNNIDQVESFSSWAVVESGPQKAVGVIFWAKLQMNLKQFLEHYAKFENELIKKGERPELSKVVYIEKKEANKDAWLLKIENPVAEYLPIVFDNINKRG